MGDDASRYWLTTGESASFRQDATLDQTKLQDSFQKKSTVFQASTISDCLWQKVIIGDVLFASIWKVLTPNIIPFLWEFE